MMGRAMSMDATQLKKQRSHKKKQASGAGQANQGKFYFRLSVLQKVLRFAIIFLLVEAYVLKFDRL